MKKVTCLGFCLTLAISMASPVGAAPTVSTFSPAAGAVVNLTEVTVTFSAPVTGVAAEDFHLNGAPATSVSGSGTTYTYVFTQPPEGPAQVQWDINHDITDLSGARFDETLPGSSWSYDVIDQAAPQVMLETPAATVTLRTLRQIEVQFDEPVLGVDAADLLVGGNAATNVTGAAAGPYLFEFAEPSPGAVSVTWAAGHGITDTAAVPNAFGGAGWSYDLNPGADLGDVVINEILAENLTGILDEDGQKNDWLELHNRGASPVRLLGWSLTTSTNRPGRWVLPDVTLSAGQYLVIQASGKDRKPTNGDRLHTDFRLNPNGDYIGLYGPELPRDVVSEYAPVYPEQRGDISFGLATDVDLVYFPVPTPGAANSVGVTFAGVVARPTPSEGSGLFSEPFDLHLSSRTEGAAIRYTLDGSVPTESSPQFTSAIPVAGVADKASVVVRAAAFRVGLLPSAVVTRTYIFPQHVLTQPAVPDGFPDTWVDQSGLDTSGDYEMDPEVITAENYAALALEGLQEMPTLSIVSDIDFILGPVNGVYSQRDDSNHRPCNAELILPDGSEGFNIDCGFEIQGGSSATDSGGDWKAKHLSMRLMFKGEFGATKLRYQVFPDSPVDRFDTLIVDAGLNLTWNHMTSESQRLQAQYVRDQFMSDSQIVAGGIAPHGRFVHVYLNGIYWGIYNLHERPDDNFAEEYFGGDQSEYDVLKHRVSTVVAGDNSAYNTMFAIARSGLANNSTYENLQQYLDVPWFVDYMLVNFWAGNDDWSHQNWYAIRKRETGAGYRFISWDAEHVIKSVTYNAVVDNDSTSPTELFQLLRNNSEFRLLVADRAHHHWFNGGIFYVDPVNRLYDPAFPERNVPAARYMARINEIDPSIVCESARWGDADNTAPYTRNVHWIDELDALMGRRTVSGHNNNYFPNRSANVLAQLQAASLYPSVAAPVFSQHGGRVPAGFELAMSAASGTIYYTTTGVDPRVYGSGNVSPLASLYTGSPVALQGSVVVKARARNGSTWSALNEAEFIVGRLGSPLRFTEIMYHPIGDEPYEFIEMQNPGTVPVDLNGYTLAGVTFAFQPGDSLAPGARLVLANEDNPGAFSSRYPGVSVFGYFNGSLDNGGETLTLKDAIGNVATSVAYDDENGWPVLPDGQGPSLVVIDIDGDPDAASNWRASVSPNGTPGLPPEPAPSSPVVLNEVMAYNLAAFPHDGFFPDWVELHNTTGTPVDISEWSLSDNADPRRFVFPANTTIPEGGYLRVWCDTNNLTGLNSGFALNLNGESLGLFDPGLNRMDAVSWGPQVADLTVGRVGGVWVLTEPTMSAANSAAVLASASQLVINEWLADPVPGADDWVELHNRSTTLPASAQGIYLSAAGQASQILSLTFLAPGGYLQLIADKNPGPDHLDFKLPGAGGEIVLSDSTAAELNGVLYGLQVEGVSEGRFPDGTANIESFPGSVSPGAANYRADYSGPVINEVAARNISGTQDSAGRFLDWVELRNDSGSAFDLSGMALSDKAGGNRWFFPAEVSVPPNGYLVIYFDASRPPSMAAEADLNTGLGLDGNNGGVFLFNALGQRVDSVEYGFQIIDRTIGLSGGNWRLLDTPTPGAANASPASLSNPALVRINEWVANPVLGDDWFELFNLGTSAADLTGLFLTDDLSIPGRVNTQISPLSFIAAGGHVQVIADGSAVKGRNHVNFNLNADGDAIRLYGADFSVIDTVQFGLQSAGQSQGRLPDGGPSLTRFATPTPGEANAFAPGPPIIVQHPASVGVLSGETATFEVLAGGTGPLTYQWFYNGLPLFSETGPTLVIPDPQPEQQGGYSVVVANDFGAVTSVVAVLSIEGPPLFLVTPPVLTVTEGSTISMTVVTSGTLPMGYRWRRGGATVLLEILNSHVSTLTIPNVSATDAGIYTVIATNSLFFAPGELTRPGGRLTVLADADGDGIPDDVENGLGLNANDPSDGGDDLDGDGGSNVDEFNAGTALDDPESLLLIDPNSVELDGEHLIFSFAAVTGHGYSVQCGREAEGPWTTVRYVTPVTEDGPVTVTSSIPFGVVQKYYRVVTPVVP